MPRDGVFPPRAPLPTAAPTRREEWLRALLPPLLLTALVGIASHGSYLLAHVLAELFSVVIAATALVVASTSRHFTRNHFVVFIATAIGWCALLDLAHTLAYKGMDLLPVNGANPATQLWIAARFLQAMALLVAPLFLRRVPPMPVVHACLGLYVLACLAAIAGGVFPDAFIEGQGLTPFKIQAEYLIMALMAAALWRYWRARAAMPAGLFLGLAVALVAMIGAEFAFTRYVSVYAGANLAGHLLKILAYWFIYLALVRHTLREPFDMLSRAASTYDAVPDPTLIVRADGRIVQANRAAAQQAGHPAEHLVGRSSHELFHDPATPAAQCPVCRRIAHSPAPFHEEITRADGSGAFEYSVAPFTGGMAPTHVQVVRDVTERRRLAREREQLVRDLGERIKELRCLHDLANLAEQPSLDIPGLLAGAAATLPPAFLYPDRLRAGVSSIWGNFGHPEADNPPCLLERHIPGPHGEVGRVWVAYPERPTDAAPFLPEEAALMDAVANRLGDAIEHKLAGAKIRRLSYLYEMLSATNRAVVHCQDTDALLQALYEALITHGTFPMLFIARRDPPDGPLRVLHARGVPDEESAHLHAAMSDMDGPFGQALGELMQGHIVCLTVPDEVPPDSWLAYLHARHYHERALLPLLRDGTLYGLVGLYSRDNGAFDADERRLLDEMATDMSFALDRLLLEQRRQAAEAQASLSEHRFREVFESSPLPMQIHDLANGCLRAINRAHQAWLGYALDEIATDADWLERAYADPVVRTQLHAAWRADVERARRSGEVVSSPELVLRSKDGDTRLARGTMTVIGSDAVIAWTDLTDIRRGEHALRESEQRFRGMIEQTLTGILVRDAGGLIYVNPRFREIAGAASDDALLGHDLAEFVPDPAARQQLDAAWRSLRAGEPSISLSVPFQRRDGTRIELGLHATRIDWDGQPAMIAMAQDVTERNRAEQQIANYVTRLETAMKSTLQAVSNMVDLRDPYTAGHERRVGLIAGAIGRELGWPAARCDSLEMIGLVHDIGKIAVPAEILSKPTRLSALEMELVRGHAQAGHDILKDVAFDAPVAEIILQHHERLDGSGYPRGLAGADILPEARVLAVADVLESMAAHRPYRPALGLAAALDELRRGRDRLYDAEAVDAVCRLIEHKGYTLPG